MAKQRNSNADSDQEMEDVSKRNPKDDGSEEEEEDEEEYEIEAILDAKPGVFEGGRVGYLVKWKGYDETSNSWVNENDAANAQSLIDEYWAKHSKQKKGMAPRKSDVPKPKATSTSSKGRKSQTVTDHEASTDPEIESISAPVKKRSRPSKAPVVEDSDLEEEVVPKPKKAKQTPAKASTSARKKIQTPEAEENGEEPLVDLTKFRDLTSWENYVDHIETVERVEGGKLYVYFILNATGKKKAGQGHLVKCKEDSEICKQKMPQHLLDFYEQNLRWARVDEA
ncbi:hypothetical protein ABKN59_003605 [Abortiporus biennis]